MFSLTPTNKRFYDHFDRAAEQVVDVAARYRDLLSHIGDAEARVAEIGRLENLVDDEVHQTMALLHDSFIAPLERGDIRRVIQGLDSIADAVNAAAKRILLYRITEPLPEMDELSSILVRATEAVRDAVAAIRKLRDKALPLQLCVRINELENEGDRLHRQALGALFDSGRDALWVMKWKEVLEFTETAVDNCEAVADVVEGIVAENA